MVILRLQDYVWCHLNCLWTSQKRFVHFKSRRNHCNFNCFLWHLGSPLDFNHFWHFFFTYPHSYSSECFLDMEWPARICTVVWMNFYAVRHRWKFDVHKTIRLKTWLCRKTTMDWLFPRALTVYLLSPIVALSHVN